MKLMSASSSKANRRAAKETGDVEITTQFYWRKAAGGKLGLGGISGGLAHAPSSRPQYHSARG